MSGTLRNTAAKKRREIIADAISAIHPNMTRKYRFKFNATVSDRGQIFIPKVLQNYFGIKSRDKVSFLVREDGSVVFVKKRGDK